MPPRYGRPDPMTASANTHRQAARVRRFFTRTARTNGQADMDVATFLRRLQSRASNPMHSLAHDALFRPPFSTGEFRRIFAVTAGDMRVARRAADRVQPGMRLPNGEAAAAYRRSRERLALLVAIISRDPAALHGGQPSPPSGLSPEQRMRWVSGVAWAQSATKRLLWF